MATEREFDKVCGTAPESIRQAVYQMAWENAFADGAYQEHGSDAARWAVAIATAEMIIDAPADYDLTA